MKALPYPYTAWRLMPSFKPVEVEIVKGGPDGSGSDANGKYYRSVDLFEDKDAAVSFGRRKLSAKRVVIAIALGKIARQEKALDKASNT